MACITSFKLMESDNSVGWKGRGKNVSKCDTKGCLPLEVQIKKYLLAGKKLEELRCVNTFEDYDEAYKDVPIATQDMDITEILELENRAQEILKARANERLAVEEAAENRAELSTTRQSAGAQTGDKAGAPTSVADAVVNSSQ